MKIKVNGSAGVSLNADEIKAAVTLMCAGETAVEAHALYTDVSPELVSEYKKYGKITLTGEYATQGDKGKNYIYRAAYEVTAPYSYAAADGLAQLAARYTAERVTVELRIGYALSNSETLREELLLAAIDNARDKAQIISSHIGAKCCKIAEIDYNDYGYQQMRTAAAQEHGAQLKQIQLSVNVSAVFDAQ